MEYIKCQGQLISMIEYLKWQEQFISMSEYLKWQEQLILLSEYLKWQGQFISQTFWWQKILCKYIIQRRHYWVLTLDIIVYTLST